MCRVKRWSRCIVSAIMRRRRSNWARPWMSACIIVCFVFVAMRRCSSHVMHSLFVAVIVVATRRRSPWISIPFTTISFAFIRSIASLATMLTTSATTSFSTTFMASIATSVSTPSAFCARSTIRSSPTSLGLVAVISVLAFH